MKEKQLEKILKKMDSEIKVPAGLAAKISTKVDARAKVLERRQLVWSTAKLGAALLVMIYGLTAATITLMESQIVTFLATIVEVPSLLFSYEGARALLERLPVVSGVILLGAALYAVRHMAIRGVRKNTAILGTVMASLAVVVVSGAFVAGMAIGVNSSDDVQQLAGNKIFSPIVQAASQHQFGTSGQLASVEVTDDGAFMLLKTADGEERSVSVGPKFIDDFKKKNGVEPKPGDNVFIIGHPEAPFPGGTPEIKANYLKLL
jgi:hypothetical protein